MAIIEDKKPNVAILVGPFLDLKNNAVVSSEMNFSNQWVEIVKIMTDKVADLQTQIILGTEAKTSIID